MAFAKMSFLAIVLFAAVFAIAQQPAPLKWRKVYYRERQKMG
jgi:hypothetical protein